MQDNEHKKKRKAGLHKEISSIFEGIPVPGMGKRPSDAAVPEQAEQGPEKASASERGDQQTIPSMKPGPVKQPASKVAAAKKTGKSIWQKIKDKLFQSESGVSSSRQKVTLILIPILIVALIYVLMPLFKRPEISRPGEAGPAGVAVGDKGEIDWRVPEPYPTTLRDPMQASSSANFGKGTGTVESGGALLVKGIVHSMENPAAVIGTQIVHEGDIIAGASVVKINQDSVEFKMDGKRWVQKVQR
jgi:hypothetical protein